MFALNTAIDTNSIQERFIISPEPIGEVTPIANDTSFSFRFETESDVTYTVTILAGIEDIYGNSIDTDYATTFSTTIEPEFEPEPEPEDFIRFKRLPYRFSIAGTYLELPRIEIEYKGDISATFRIYRILFAELPESLPIR